jgi:NADPH:quinone reductase-like Zn-dependent oxidoreductase
VEAVGKNVKQFQPGDEVFGDVFGTGFGSFAEYVCIPESAALVPKPASLTFEEAAAVPQGAVIALQGLRKGEIESGQNVLINGAGGSVGTFAVQIAKSFGAEVTGVDSTPKLDMLRSIGADHVIDYTQEDFTQSGQRYDVILDVKGYRSVRDYKRALSSEGVCVWTGGSTPRMIEVMVLGGKRVSVLMAEVNKDDLIFVTELLETRKVAPVIDKRYPLNQVADALQYLGEGHVQGKLVITV